MLAVTLGHGGEHGISSFGAFDDHGCNNRDTEAGEGTEPVVTPAGLPAVVADTRRAEPFVVSPDNGLLDGSPCVWQQSRAQEVGDIAEGRPNGDALPIDYGNGGRLRRFVNEQVVEPLVNVYQGLVAG